MKKLLAALLSLIMILALCSCGTTNPNASIESDKKEEESVATEIPVEEVETIQIGETVKTENYELTLNSVQIGGLQKDNQVRTRGGSGVYRTDGNAIVYVAATLKNLSKQEVNTKKCFCFM